jgi:hypothetical protein
MNLSELDTPVLTADLNAVGRNIAGMQAYCDVVLHRDGEIVETFGIAARGVVR